VFVNLKRYFKAKAEINLNGSFLKAFSGFFFDEKMLYYPE